MTHQDVLSGQALWSVEQADALAWLKSLPADSVDLLFASPPYLSQRTYGIDAVYECQEWIEWMIHLTEAALPACKGLIAWVVAGAQEKCNYQPGPEGLVYEWWKRGHYQWCPTVWWKVDDNEGGTGIPGSGGKQGLRKDWEYVLMFRRDKELAWADNTAMGHEPVYSAVGGAMSNRTAEGRRINAGVGSRLTDGRAKEWNGDGFGNVGPSRRANGVKKMVNRDKSGKRKKNVPMEIMDAPGAKAQDGTTKVEGSRPMPKIANPGNVLPLIVKARVGGGHIGDDLAHEGEAPFPERLAEFFVRSYCPEGGVTADCFSGSGTTAKVCLKWGRRFIGCDLRQSQVDLTTKRVNGASSLFDALPTEST